jgi:hypothetical protein
MENRLAQLNVIERGFGDIENQAAESSVLGFGDLDVRHFTAGNLSHKRKRCPRDPIEVTAAKREEAHLIVFHRLKHEFVDIGRPFCQ